MMLVGVVDKMGRALRRDALDITRWQDMLEAAVADLAEDCVRSGEKLLPISTVYVFDGTKGSPNLPDATANLLNVCGESKLAVNRACTIFGDGRSCYSRLSLIFPRRPKFPHHHTAPDEKA